MSLRIAIFDVSKEMRVAVIGAGSFGTAIARVVGSRCQASPSTFCETVALYARRQNLVEEINQHHTNQQYLGSAAIPSNVVATSDMVAAVQDAKFVVLAVPSDHLKTTLDVIRPNMAPDAVVVSLLKGLH